MPNPASADWLIVLIYLFFVLTAGFSLRPVIMGSKEYLEGGRALPAWLCGLGLAAAGFGVQAPAILSVIGARYGFESIPFALLGGIPALLFLGTCLMPVYHGSGARTIPEYLSLRFDSKTRLLTACLLLVSAVAGAALSLFVMARVFTALHIFDTPVHAAKMASTGAFLFSMALPAVLVAACVMMGGLAGSIYTQVLQLFVVTAGFLPVVFLGLKQIGWSGLKTAAAAAASSFPRDLNGSAQTGIAACLLAGVLGLIFGAGFWCADFRVVQTAMAAKNAKAARKAPLIAAAAWVLVPLLLILPGIVALDMKTPHTEIMVHNDNGVIYHEISVVPAAAEAGRGLVPAAVDPATGKPRHAADGSMILDCAQAAPNLLAHYLPMGMLGLGIAALLACVMSGAAACLMAFDAVFACDIFQAFLRKNASDRQLLAAGRWAAAGGMALALALACAAFFWHWQIETLAEAFFCINAPLLAAILAGMFWKRTTGHGAFAGIASGIAATALPFILICALPGARAGWIAWLRQSPLALNLWAVIAGAAVCLLVAVAVSKSTQARPEIELRGLMYSPVQRKLAKALLPRPDALTPSTAIFYDARIPMGMLFTLTGTILMAFGLGTRNNAAFYAASLGINGNLWWGAALLAFGITLIALGRRGQARLEKGRK